jgi:NTP-dependent ternary system trypsin peptidase co-occuring protein
MTEEFVQVRAADGSYIPFEVDTAYDGPVQAGRVTETLDHAGAVIEAGVDHVKEIARSVVERVRSLPPPAPSKVAVEIGLKMSASAGLVVAKAATEAHIKISIEWQPTPPKDKQT